MHPTIFGFIDSYSLFIFIGACFAFLILYLLLKKDKKEFNFFLDLVISGTVSIIIGIVFAMLYENLYEYFKDPKNYKFTYGMTFYGGLFGGVFTFLIIYFLYLRKKYKNCITEILKVAPVCILIAHAFGRIGCFLAGCCYGIETDSAIGVEFVSTPGIKVIPTNLIEAIFLFLFFIILFISVYKFDFKYSMSLYLLLYSIFRFIIEFYRGDERGAFLGPLSPSQVWCIGLFALSIPVLFITKYLNKHEKNTIS